MNFQVPRDYDTVDDYLVFELFGNLDSGTSTPILTLDIDTVSVMKIGAAVGDPTSVTPPTANPTLYNTIDTGAVTIATLSGNGDGLSDRTKTDRLLRNLS